MPRPTRPHRCARFGRIAALLTLALLVCCVTACARSATVPQAPRSQSRHVVAAAPTHTLTYVAIGASDAFGIGTDNPQTQSWPSVLAGLLGPRVHLLNLGIPGMLIGEAQTTELPVALDAHPDIVTIWLAVNDFAGDTSLTTYDQQLRAMLAALKQHTHARIFVANLPDLSLLPAFAGQDQDALRTRIHQWNAIIATDCAAQSATLVDLYANGSALSSHPEYISADGFHPSAAGAAALAALFASTMRAAGAP